MLNFEISGFFNVFDSSSWLSDMNYWATYLISWAQTKYAEAPALVLGVGIALALPLIALASAVIRLLLGYSKPVPVINTPTARTQPVSLWRQHATLELANAESFQINQGIIRIGRETDNDLCLSHPTVHRYHAVLERSPDAEFMISYIGDPDHDGLRIDGRAAERQRLRGGEILEIGAIQLRFALSPA